MPRHDADRSLLFGILALQNNFVNREALLTAFTAWIVDKRQPLGEILCRQGKLTQQQDELLRALVEQHVKQHGNDPQQSLAAVSSIGSMPDDLRKLGDAELEASLAAVAQQPKPADPHATNLPSTRDWRRPEERFRVLRPHKKGGLGEVFVARDMELNREVALKEIQSRFADEPDSRSRFVIEAEITGGLEHPGIVPVYGLGQYADGRPFYAMRFIRGDSLAEAISRFHLSDGPGRAPGERDLELRKLLGRFIDVCEAIEYAHSRGILHRDLKPGNIMLGKYGETLVVDWGLAKSVGRGELTSNAGETTLKPASGDNVDPSLMGSAIGTPAYMSPEQAAGRLDELGPASDVYSLGATLYCLLTGRPPFSGKDKGEILARVVRGDFPRPQKLQPQVPAPLQAICLKAMSLSPLERYLSPQRLAGDIEHWLADEPVSCYREPLNLRMRRWMKRHRTLVTLSAVAALVFVASLVSLLGLVSVHNQTLDVKNRQLDDANLKLTKANADLNRANGSERAAKHVADQKRAEAETARDETTKVLDYLVAAFRKSDPDADGEKLTVVEMFDQAVAQMDESLPKQPLIQARLLSAIGRTYCGLGLYQKAVPVSERARDLRLGELGADHEETLKAQSNLASTYEDAGKMAKALALYQETLEHQKALLGTDHPETLTSMNNLALTYLSEGHPETALPLLEKTLELRTLKLGPKHQDTLTSMNNLASGYREAGRLTEALPMLEKTLELRTATLGERHSETLSSMNNLASAYRSAGRREESLLLFEQALELMRSKLGPEHPETLNTMHNLASAYDEAGRVEEAISLLEETLELKRARLGPSHSKTISSMNNLAQAYKSAGKLKLAVPLLEQTLELAKASFGLNDQRTLMSTGNLAQAHLWADQPEKALPLYDQFIAGHRGQANFDDARLAGLLAAVSADLLEHRQYGAAEKYLRESLTIREQKQADAWNTFNTQAMLGGSLLGLGKFAEAEPLLLSGYQGMKKREGMIPPPSQVCLIEALQRLVQLYDAWDKKDEAQAWRKKLEQHKASIDAAGKPRAESSSD